MIVRVEDGTISITDGVRVLVVDRLGRILIYSNGRKTYRRSLLNVFVEVGYRESIRIARRLSEDEARIVVDEAYSFLRRAERELRPYMDNIESLGWEFLVSDSAKLMSIYSGPVPIVPPDQYFPIYVQVTVGCAWNRCTFCHLYRDMAYRVLEPEELYAQIKGLVEYFGPTIRSRRSVFLGDANALLVEQDRIRSYMRIIRESFNLPMYSFIDGFLTPRRLRVEDLRELRNLGLTKVYFGIESGNEDVLRILNKPMSTEEALSFISAVKRAGINVGLIFLAGAGGRRYWEQHVRDSARFVSRLELERLDTVFISPLHEYPDLPYYSMLTELGKLSEEDKWKQFQEMKRAIEETYLRNRGIQLQAPVVLYDIVESVY
ncbi:MAG: radical SAM protein [Nitrososphaeria archaeon]